MPRIANLTIFRRPQFFDFLYFLGLYIVIFQITDPEGRPLDGAQVSLTFVQRDGKKDAQTHTAGKDGRFKIPKFSAAAYRALDREKSTFVVAYKDKVMARAVPLPRAQPAEKGLLVRLQALRLAPKREPRPRAPDRQPNRQSAITVALRDERDRRVTNAIVKLHYKGKKGIETLSVGPTDERGLASLPVSPELMAQIREENDARPSVSVSRKDVPVMRVGVQQHSPRRLLFDIFVRRTPSERPDPRPRPPAPKRHIRAQILDANRKPVVGLLVSLFTPARKTPMLKDIAVTNGEGQITVELGGEFLRRVDPADFTVAGSKDGTLWRQTNKARPRKDGPDWRVRWQVAPEVVVAPQPPPVERVFRAEVLDRKQRPVPDLLVSLFSGPQENPVLPDIAVTNGEGQFTLIMTDIMLRRLDPRTFRMQGTKDGVLWEQINETRPRAEGSNWRVRWLAEPEVVAQPDVDTTPPDRPHPPDVDDTLDLDPSAPDHHHDPDRPDISQPDDTSPQLPDADRDTPQPDIPQPDVPDTDGPARPTTPDGPSQPSIPSGESDVSTHDTPTRPETDHPDVPPDIPPDERPDVPPAPQDTVPDTIPETPVMTQKGKNLFRFNTLRPAKTQEDQLVKMELAEEPSTFLKEFRAAQEKPQAAQVAKSYTDDQDFFRHLNPERSALGPLIRFMTVLYTMDRNLSFEVAKENAIARIQDFTSFEELEDLAKDRVTLWDHYIAAQSAPDMREKQRAAVLDALKASYLIQAIEKMETWEDMLKWLTAMPLLPDWVIVLIAGRFRTTFPYVAGITDLMVVKENWLRYERGEIAHIENVMATETRTRTLRKLDSSTLTSTNEYESTEETSKETENSVHSSMANEVEKTIANEAALSTGVNVSAKYGPAVKVDANASFDFSTSSEETRKSVEEYAQDIVEKASTKLTVRERSETVSVITTETEDTQFQSFTNVGTDTKNIAGIYRYVDQIWEAQVFNYGKRVMLDIVVPEPAVMWRQAHRDGAIAADQLEEPPVFDVNPADIAILDGTAASGNGYQQLAAFYGAGDVPPPPDSKHYVTTSVELDVPNRGGSEANSTSQSKGQIAVPEGYGATNVKAEYYATSWVGEDNDRRVAKFLANGEERDIDNRTATVNVTNVVGPVEFGIYTDEMQGGVLTVELECEVLPEALAQWRLDVFNALKRANDNAWQDFHANMKSKEALKSMQQETMHPAAKRLVERNELKRAAVSILSEDNMESAGAVTFDKNPPDADDVPRIDFEDALTKGSRARFFEEAFEWEQMTYLYYPYFWARQDIWFELMNQKDPDVMFEAFLKSGAARVNLAIRPGFEAAVMWFMATGQVWFGGPTPMVGDPLYVALIDEIVETKGRDLDEPVEVGLPWTYELPTNLIILDPDDRLIPPPSEPPNP